MNQKTVTIDGRIWTIRELRVRDRISAAAARQNGYGDGDALVIMAAAGAVACEGLDLPTIPAERMAAIESVFEKDPGGLAELATAIAGMSAVSAEGKELSASPPTS
jgi:hypothetical protein